MDVVAIVPLPADVPAAAVLAQVAGEAALVRVVGALIGPNRVPQASVIVVAADPLMADVRACLDAAGLSGVPVLASGAPGTRRQCLASGIEYVGRERPSASHVLVHDHRHPLAPADVTDRVIAALRSGHPVVVPVLPMTDTVKAVDDRGAVIGTVDRTTLRTVQYPRGYERSVLAESIIGDMEWPDVPIATVDGDADGFAAELPADVDLLEAIRAAHRPG
ncbi:2-C-methyl-D-erythritol 4-phosphate cytidylyltransferase [Mycobacterium sp. URHB0044]|uniref:IspD/TarI family cytidylyltransferase n=1 Tax=Mycobacterium sp. URHB0044 TaxID=1380386 RepID=UPI00048AFC96|nr:2-C-methyl-D-erythritol 4-phosphate cytidylyltransferase [Mycobacterium sp. URHB0044]